MFRSPKPIVDFCSLEQFRRRCYPSLKPKLEAVLDLEATIRRSEASGAPLRVAILGRFCAGKSRLINVLMGREVLPHSAGECTAAAIHLVHSTEEYYRRIEAGRVKECSRDVFFQTQDAERQRKVASGQPPRYEVGQPLQALMSLELIDTPGFDGTNVERKQLVRASIEWAVEHADVCVLVITKGVAQEDIELCKSLQKNQKQWIILANRSDDYDRDEMREICAEARKHLCSLLGDDVRAFAVSALWEGVGERERDQIRYRRESIDHDEEPLHQWDDFLWLLRQKSERLATVRFLQRMDAWKRMLRLISEVDRAYSIQEQATCELVRNSNQVLLKIADEDAREFLQHWLSLRTAGQVAPWGLLERNQWLAASALAPAVRLTQGLGVPMLQRMCVAVARALAGNPVLTPQNCAQLRRCLLEAARSVPEGTEIIADTIRALDWADWGEFCRSSEFTYSDGLQGLIRLWRSSPGMIERNTNETVGALKAALRRLGASSSTVGI